MSEQTTNKEGEVCNKDKLKRWSSFIKLCDSIDNIMEITRKMAVMTASNDPSMGSSVVGDQMATVVDLLKLIQTIADDKSYEHNLGELPVPMEILQRVDNAENPQRLTLHGMQTVFRRNLEDTNRISSLCNLRTSLMAVLQTEMPESMFAYRAVQETGPKTKENILVKIANKKVEEETLAEELGKVNMSEVGGNNENVEGARGTKCDKESNVSVGSCESKEASSLCDRGNSVPETKNKEQTDYRRQTENLGGNGSVL